VAWCTRASGRKNCRRGEEPSRRRRKSAQNPEGWITAKKRKGGNDEEIFKIGSSKKYPFEALRTSGTLERPVPYLPGETNSQRGGGVPKE